MQSIILDANKQKILYDEIKDCYDLVDDIFEVIETRKDYEEEQESQFSLVEDLVNQVTESINGVIEKYIDWVKGGMSPKKSDISETEKLLRKALSSCYQFIDKVKNIESEKEDTEEDLIELKDTIRKVKKRVMPVIGEEAGELIHGKKGISFHEQIVRLPSLRRLIQSVKNVMDHFFRITYCFFFIKNGLVSNPHKVVQGRAMPDAKARMLLEKQKIRDVRATNLTKSSDQYIYRMA